MSSSPQQASLMLTVQAEPKAVPLAAKMRPTTFDEVVGHTKTIAQLRTMLKGGVVPSLLFWGPPGTGKTTLAYIVANEADAVVEELSAVSAGIKDVREKIANATQRTQTTGKTTIVFIDEIHRFNKSQQDALLPAVEAGQIVLIGATTENPAIEITKALLSRTLLFTLELLTDDDLAVLVDRAQARPECADITITVEAKAALIHAAQGDARVLLTILDAARLLVSTETNILDVAEVTQVIATPHLRYDKAADNHYDMVSAFIKSMRGSDTHAAVYWLTRMLHAGEDPKFLARRMIILASEDIGLADPNALVQATAALQALQMVGLPEARYALTQACMYLALAPKSNSVTTTMMQADKAVKRLGNAPVPVHLRDGHYAGAKDLGHAVAYAYPHDFPGNWTSQIYAPEGLGYLYSPGTEGVEPDLTTWRRTRTSVAKAQRKV